MAVAVAGGASSAGGFRGAAASGVQSRRGRRGRACGVGHPGRPEHSDPRTAARQVVEVRPRTDVPTGAALAAALQVACPLKLLERPGDQDLALGEVLAQGGDGHGGAVGQREDVGRDADGDRAAASLSEGVGDHGEAYREAGAYVDHAGGLGSGVGAQARVRLRFSHWEGVAS